MQTFAYDLPDILVLFYHSHEEEFSSLPVWNDRKKKQDETLLVMDHPLQTPDLNNIKAVWDHFNREWNKRQL